MTPKLEVRGLNKTYQDRRRGAVEVLRNISLMVQEGEFVCIVGASGCGKTTFLRIIDGLVPADTGAVILDGREVGAPGTDRAFVFQADSLYPWRTVEENVCFGLEIQGRPREECRRASTDLIRLVGLKGFERHYPHELSGGMRQRVNLARALAVKPAVLLMDEPFAALDAQTREIMQMELLRIWNQQRKTVLFITHQIDEAVYLADRVLVFSARPGRIKADIRIELPRPRPLSVKRTPEFALYAEKIWTLIEEEVLDSMGMAKEGGRAHGG